jgi:hypothetical protein
VFAFYFDRIKMPAYLLHAEGVAYCNDGIRYFLRPEIEVIDSAAGIDDQLRFCYSLHGGMIAEAFDKHRKNILFSRG